MTEGLTHLRENNSDTEQHLSENREKFETDAVFLWRLMQRGERLTRQIVVEKYKICDRRLGDLHSEGKCEKEWKLNEKGKRMYVEYFVPIHKLPSKTEVIQKATIVIDMMKRLGKGSQQELF